MEWRHAEIINHEERERIAAFNHELECEAVPFRLNETVLERSLHRLEALDVGTSVAYWMTYARVAELVLFCAGGYADAMEFRAAGDLLVNPRCVLIHLPSDSRTVIKDRHRPLTEQFAHVASKRSSVVQWLKRNAVVQVSRKPLLPLMASRLRSSGALSEDYLESVDARMRKLADNLAFFALRRESVRFAAGNPPEAVPPCEQELRMQNRCGFDLQEFNALGGALEEMLGVSETGPECFSDEICRFSKAPFSLNVDGLA